jgi:hypothetical protein
MAEEREVHLHQQPPSGHLVDEKRRRDEEPEDHREGTGHQRQHAGERG